MKQLFKAILIYSFFILFIEGPTVAQLYGIGFDDTVTVNSQLGGKDTVYVYNATDRRPENNLYTRRGALEAVSPDRTSGWKFIWSQYNYVKRIFFDTDSAILSGSNSLIREHLVSGGYQVCMKKGTIVDTFRAWVFINKLRLHLRKTPDGKISTFYSHCSYIQLGAIKKNDFGSDTSLSYIHNDFYYANPVAGNANSRFRNDTNVVWTSRPDAGYIEGKTQVNKYDPPTVITKFYVSFSDTFGNTAKDTVSYDPIRTIADFDVYTFQSSKFDSMQTKDSTLAYTKGDSALGEAPLRVKFKNKSKNGFSFEWFLLDTFHRDNNAIIRQTDYIPSNDSLDSIGYVYFRPIDVTPAPYKVKLFSYGPNKICIDSAIRRAFIEPSRGKPGPPASKTGSDTLSFPTAFIPGDVVYGYFTFKEFTDTSHANNHNPTGARQINWYSIRSLHLTVYSQWGRLMYEYNGPVLDVWKGWDGKTRYGSDAPPGIYFYVYEALGWGPISKPPDSKLGDFTAKGRGFVYLLRK